MSRLPIPNHLLHVGASICGTFILYLLGAGPAAYLWTVAESSHAPIEFFYDPLLHTVRDTRMEDVLAAYQVWWADLARTHTNLP
jgi:hypothetical protein